MTDTIRTHRTPTLIKVMVGLLFLWISGAVILSQQQMSPTFDEQNHVTRGIAILRTGDYRLSLHHPPLANILEGLPVAWQLHGFSTDMPAWKTLNIWDASNTTIWTYPAVGLSLIEWARVPVLLFTLLLGLIVFVWAKELFGPLGGLLSLTLFAFEPNILAHSGLATTDMAAACTLALAMFLLRRYLAAPGRARLAVAGAGIGLALTAKFSGLILVPIVGLILLALALRPFGGFTAAWAARPTWQRLSRAFGLYLLLGVLAGVMVWIVYGCRIEPLGSKPGQPLPATASALERLPVPALQYLRGLKTVATEAEAHPAYLLGKTDTTGKGWWYYFPVAIAAKTPIPELCAFLGILLLLALPQTRPWLRLPQQEVLFLLLPVGVFLLAASGILGISLNLGIRHILPIYPFLLILAGGWAVVPAKFALYRLAVGTVLGMQLATVLLTFPNFLAYFNEVAGGPEQGYRVLVDSNFDWGQDLARLATLQKAHNLRPLYFSYFGTTPPEAYGLEYHPLPGFGVMRGAPMPRTVPQHNYYVAVSATNLFGGNAYIGREAAFLGLRNYRPDYVAGKTVFVYYVP